MSGYYTTPSKCRRMRHRMSIEQFILDMTQRRKQTREFVAASGT
jgi:hypothetical protein